MDYYEEKLKAFLDSINMLYVAFTRPVDALIVCGKLPKSPKGKDKLDLNTLKMKQCSDFALSIVKDLDGFDESTSIYEHGRWKDLKNTVKKPGDEPVQIREFELTEYHSHSWRKKTQLQMRGAAELGDALFTEAQQQGIRVHELISKVKYKSDLKMILDVPERVVLKQLIEHPEMADWFDSRWKVDTEVAILLPNGNAKRIDRINRTKDETLVIDFKTGVERDNDLRQIKNYINILSEMSYPKVRGYLVYLSRMEVVLVE